jgi:hypothetical protein
MRDIKAKRDININGDLNVNESPKMLIQCTTEELLEEKKYRKNILSGEYKKRAKIGLIFLSIAIVFGLFISVWYQLNGKVNISMFTIGIITILTPLGFTWITFFQESEFIQRQNYALREISLILQERNYNF